MEQYRFTVEKMTCDGCAAKVKAAAEAVEGVENVVVDRKKKLLTLDAGSDPTQQVIESVSATGYPTQPKTGVLKKLFGA
ncbi:MAG: heavy-metal-associated domain-containing protein [Lentisphaeria bacterium]|nr:heavy-metal-associated domain-containing protein [Candidatus Neomarinimicrobiota bacterium]MCF7842806.1 heavy-metal-associated domain-containing protein [Lentisphaeria bacterium]